MQIEGGSLKIGVLSLQGGVIEHINHLKKLKVEAIEVKKIKDLQGIQGLILPGGESTTLGILLNVTEMMEPIRKKILEGLPVWGTCAGMILLAKDIKNDERKHLAVLDIEVMRNGYGRQIDSFKEIKVLPEISKEEPSEMIFIRAPYITKILNNKVKVIAEVENKIVGVRQGNIIATSFHPELSEDLKFHRYFLKVVKDENK